MNNELTKGGLRGLLKYLRNSFVKSTNDVIDSFKNTDWSQVGSMLADGLNALSDTIRMIDWKGVGTGFGNGLSSILTDVKLGQSLEATLTSGLQAVADMVIEGVVSFFISIQNYLASLDPKKLWDDTVNFVGKEAGRAGNVIQGGLDNSQKATQGVFRGAENWLNGIVGNPQAKPIESPTTPATQTNKAKDVSFNPVLQFTGSPVDYEVALVKFGQMVNDHWSAMKDNVLTTV
jgi:hypothetical protein